MYVLEGPGPLRRWQLRRDQLLLVETQPEDHATARGWIAALQRNELPGGLASTREGLS